MPFDHDRKALRNGQPYYSNSAVTTGDAGDQPGAIPILDGEPTVDELPTTHLENETALIYVDKATEKVKIAIPENGALSHTVILDASGSINLSDTPVTGLL